MDRVPSPDLPQGANDFSARLFENTRIAMLTPEIAYGKDEGSQRSGQTLYSRMWPMLAHVRTERAHWTMARNLLAEMTLRILARNNRHKIGDQHLNLRKRQIWYAMVPLDRQQVVAEVIDRAQAGKISDELLVERLGDAPDQELELKRIKEMQEKAEALEQERFDTTNKVLKEGKKE
jgi:hypothetical protein